MGGTVAVILKHQNILHKLAMPTGSYNRFLFDKRMLSSEGLKENLSEYLSLNDNIKQDFFTGEPYKYPESVSQAKFSLFAPIDYGIVYVDLDNRIIHSWQSFDIPGEIILGEIGFFIKDEKFIDNIKSLIENNALIVREKVYNENFEKDLYSFFDTNDSNKIIKIINNRASYQTLFKIKKIFNPFHDLNLINTSFRLKDWKINTYDETKENLLILFNKIKKVYQFSPNEIDGWKSFALNLFEDELFLKEFDV